MVWKTPPITLGGLRPENPVKAVVVPTSGDSRSGDCRLRSGVIFSPDGSLVVLK